MSYPLEARIIDPITERNLQLTDRGLHTMSRVLGHDVRRPATPKQIERARRWRESSARRLTEQVVCRTFGLMIGEPVANRYARRVVEFDPHAYDDGFVMIPVGFLGLGAEGMVGERKIRTMVYDAHLMNTDPMQQTTIMASAQPEDTRILDCGTVLNMRRRGIDEIPQLSYNIGRMGNMDLVGLRGYTSYELAGIRQVLLHAISGRSNFTQFELDTLKRYQSVIERCKPRPAFAGMLQATHAKDTTLLERMLGDLVYLEQGDFNLYVKIIAHVIKRRHEGVGAR